MAKRVRYPVGQQSFEVLREQNRLYIDKTRFIEELLFGGNYYFLSRPRRFGKSLFLSTLKCFFQAKRHLFKGLYADSMEWDWQEYPVFYLDLNTGEYTDGENLTQRLHRHLEEWEDKYGNQYADREVGERFEHLLRLAYQKTGRRAVILVDEYDKPLVNNLNDSERFEQFRNQLSALYSNFKSGADYIRMVFLTGVSRFGKLSVFSGLNNIDDISFDDAYSDICGISEEELLSNFQIGIETLSQKYNTLPEETCAELKRRYDGYRFSSEGKEMYNPYSLMKVMDKERYGNYWIESGQPTLLKEQLKHCNADLNKLINTKCSLEAMKGLDYDNPRPVALLYQSGYLTIKGYDQATDIYTLGLPNREVEEGFLSYLLPVYANLHQYDTRFFVVEFVNEINRGDVQAFMGRLKSMFSAVPYDMEMEREQNIHNALLILMMLVGLDVRTEYRTSNGRIDLFVVTEKFYYIIELKLDGSAKEALDQIENKEYALPFKTGNRRIIKIGANFSTVSRTISEWVSDPAYNAI